MFCDKSHVYWICVRTAPGPNAVFIFCSFQSYPKNVNITRMAAIWAEFERDFMKNLRFFSHLTR